VRWRVCRGPFPLLGFVLGVITSSQREVVRAVGKQIRGHLTWRPIVPGSDLHLALIARVAPAMQRVLYPSLYEREQHRRASAVIAAAARRQTPTKQNAPHGQCEAFTAPRPTSNRNEDGCSTECA
jgi:hypothetical protein